MYCTKLQKYTYSCQVEGSNFRNLGGGHSPCKNFNFNAILFVFTSFYLSIFVILDFLYNFSSFLSNVIFSLFWHERGLQPLLRPPNYVLGLREKGWGGYIFISTLKIETTVFYIHVYGKKPVCFPYHTIQRSYINHRLEFVKFDWILPSQWTLITIWFYIINLNN